jgi:hypothetical protein
MGRCKNVSAIAAGFQESGRFALDIIDASIRQRTLRGQAPVKGEPTLVPDHKGKYIHHLRLKGIEAVKAYVNQIVKKFIHFSAAVDINVFVCLSNYGVHTLELRENEASPDARPHLQAPLLAPVVTETDSVYIIWMTANRCFI